MDRLTRFKKEEKRDRRGKAQKNQPLPVYDINGKVQSSGTKTRQNRLITLAIVVIVIAAVVYVPQIFIRDKKETNDLTVATDQTAVRMVNTVLREHPSEDFDGDGLENSEEQSLGTDAWNADTDGDGVVDMYEVKVADTDPTQFDDTLLTMQTKLDEQNGKDLGSPYKIGNVILWPSDYSSRAYGSVAEITETHYRFCNFSGYAQFSDAPDSYAYRVTSDGRSLLDYREAENVWKVEAGDEVELYDQKLQNIVRFGFLFNNITFYANAGGITSALAAILPDRGLITAIEMTSMDADPDTSDPTTTTIDKPVYDTSDESRFSVNSTTLNDLLFVRESIEQGDCIAVSLYQEDLGEYIGIIYGYDADGNLLVADPDTLQDIGTLQIKEMAKKLVDNTGAIVSNAYFDFSGFGFDSTAGSRISFFASTSSGMTTSLGDVEEDELEDEEVDENAEEPTDEATENESETEEDAEGETADVTVQEDAEVDGTSDDMEESIAVIEEAVEEAEDGTEPVG